MKKRQIAFFTADWNYELVGETLKGVSGFLADHPDVSVRVFDCFGIDSSSIEDPCVYEIYHQADLDEYDGVIIQTHQIVMKEMLNGLEERIREKGIPAVSIGTALGDMPRIETDDYASFRSITEHVIRKHGAGRLWFLKGAEAYDNRGEAVLRRRGFTDVCRDHHIPESEIRFLDGDWKAESGERTAREILSLPEDVRPDALICANDDMALGAMSVLREAGISVPGRIMVTGYDGIFSASLCTPRLCTVNRDFSGLAYRAMELVLQKADGKQIPAVSVSPVMEDFMGTCGCRGNEEKLVARIKDRFFKQTTFLHHFFFTQDKLTAALFSSTTLKDVMLAVEKYGGIFGTDGLRLYLDEKYYQSLMAATPGDGSELPVRQYSGHFILAADSCQSAGEGSPGEAVNGGETPCRTRDFGDGMTVYYPLRYGEIMVGILMLHGASEAADMDLHESLINLIVFSMENVRQRQIRNRLNEQLRELYVTDQLTGLFNRFGISSRGEEFFHRLTEAGETIRFLFLDVDDLKGINDRYGHDVGDAALRASADVLRKICGRNDFMMRYGGDEFIAFGAADGKKPELLARELLDRFNETSDLPFRLDLSVGEYIRGPESGLSLEECLRGADVQMYEVKRDKKRHTEEKKGADGGGSHDGR